MREKVTKVLRSKQVVQVLDSQPVWHSNKLHYNPYPENQLKLTFSSSISSNISLYSSGKITFFKYTFWNMQPVWQVEVHHTSWSWGSFLSSMFCIFQISTPLIYLLRVCCESWLPMCKLHLTVMSYDKYSLTKTVRATGTKVWKMLWTP